MAGTSLLALIDDIATILDDVAVMSKVAVKKTSGVLGDDLALNAQQVAGIHPDRELPVVWAVALGSLRNKAILVPSALAISALAPWAVIPLLMIGGAYLCYEGVEKLVHKFTHHDEHAEEEHHAKEVAALSDTSIDLVALERDKIKGAVRTDFILSAEILVITLGSVAGAPFGRQVAVMVVIAIVMTVGVYGLVAAIVKIDDVGLHLSQRGGPAAGVGRALVGGAPYLMKFLSIAGTAAMFLVGGGIVTHGIETVHHTIEEAAHWGHAVPGVGVVVEALIPMLLNGLAGVVVGAVILGVVEGGKRLFRGAA